MQSVKYNDFYRLLLAFFIILWLQLNNEAIYLKAQHQQPILIDIYNTAFQSGTPNTLRSINGVLYFRARRNTTEGEEIYMSNEAQGAAANYTFLRDISFGANSSSPRFFNNFNGFSYFIANDVTNGIGLWRSNGTVGATTVMYLFNPSGVSEVRNMVAATGTAGGDLLFMGADDNNLSLRYNNELWTSNGTGGATTVLKNIHPTLNFGAYPNDFAVVGNKVFFAATNGTNGYELWVSDGTNGGTNLVYDANVGTGDGLKNTTLGEKNPIIELQGFCYFIATDGTNAALYRTSGSGATKVKDIPNFDYAVGMVRAGNNLFFVADDGTNGKELWVSDGTVGGTRMITDLYAGATGSEPVNLTELGGEVYFGANVKDGMGNEYGRELCKSDGVTTQMIADLTAGFGSSDPRDIVNINNAAIYFSSRGAYQGAGKGREVWYYLPSKPTITDKNPRILCDLNPTGDANSAGSFEITGVGQSIFFTGFNGDFNIGNELWYSPPCPTVNLAYISDVLCRNSGTASPTTLPAITGGTYSASPAGLVIDANTGEINLTASAEGTYTITYAKDSPICECLAEASYIVTVVSGGGGTVLRNVNSIAVAGVNFEFPPGGPNALGGPNDGPAGIALAPDGASYYVADQQNNRIQRINYSTNAVINANFITGLNRPMGIAVDASGNIYVADRDNHQIKIYNSTGTLVTTLGTGTEGNAEGTQATAQFRKPTDVAVDLNGNIYIADNQNHHIKKAVSNGMGGYNITVFAGSPDGFTTGSANGVGTAATFWLPSGIHVHYDGTIYVADRQNSLIRRILPDGTVSTFAGSTLGNSNGATSSAQFRRPIDVTTDLLGNVYVADRSNHSIRKISAGTVTNEAGSGTEGSTDATSFASTFGYPSGLMADLSGNILVIDNKNQKLRRVFPNNTDGGKVNGARGGCKGENVTLTLTNMSGGAISGTVLKWQKSEDLGTTWTDIANATTTLNFTNIQVTTLFRAVVQQGICPTPSNYAAIVVFSPTSPVAGASPSAVCSGANYSFTLTASGGSNGSYRWFWKDTGGTFYQINGAINDSFTYNSATPPTTTPATTITLAAPNATFYVALQGSTCQSEKIAIDVPISTSPGTPSASGPRCGEGEVTLTATGANGFEKYQWYDDTETTLLKTSTNSADNTFVTSSLTATTNFKLRIVNEDLTCPTAFVTAVATVYPNPTPAITGATTACQNTSQTYNVTTPVGGNTYAWTITGGTPTNATGTSVNITWGTAGTGTITLSETTPAPANCVITTAAFNVNIVTQPAPTITGPTTDVCGTSTQEYISNPESTTNEYDWVVTGGQIVEVNGTAFGPAATTGFTVGASKVKIKWNASGAGTINLTERVPGVASCSGTATQLNVTLITVPNPTINPATANACVGGTATTLNVTPFNAGNTYAWTITGGEIIEVNGTPITATNTYSAVDAQTIKVNWTVAGAGKVELTERPASGSCDAIATPATVTVEQQPNPAIQGKNLTCQGRTETYTITNPVAGNTYTWTITGGTPTNPTGTSVNITWGAGATGTLQVNEVTPGGCTQNSTVFNVTLEAIPTPTITRITPGVLYCDKNTYTFSTSNNTNRTYTWAVSGGSIVSGQGTNQINFKLDGTIANLQVTEKINGTDCEGTSASFVINPILASPTPKVSGVALVCANDVQVYQTTLVGGNTYTWQVIGGSKTDAANTTTITWTTAGQGKVIITETNPAGCSFNDTLNVQVNPLPGNANVRNGLRCTPGQFKLYASYPQAISYRWYDATNTLVHTTTDTLFLTPVLSASTTYYVEVITVPACVGPKTAVQATLSATNIEATVSAQLTNICGRTPTGAITLTVSGGQVPYVYQWSNGATTQNLSNLTAGTYTVTITDDGGCTTVRTYTLVEDFNTVKVSAGPDVVAVRGLGIELRADSPTGVAFKWTPTQGLSDPAAQNPIATPDSTTTYIVEVTDQGGCIGFDTITVDVNDFYIPNTFTPNTDNINDKFNIQTTKDGVVSELSIKIFDRNGLLVFEANNIDQILTKQTNDNIIGWDGTFKGEPMPAGNYIWELKGKFANGQEIIFNGKNTGNLLLVR
ncbi:MAG: hypothetical protein EAZ55_12275 [Cytophagales bacterium]|nr:MAG: hypothetical protein EAZ55_12275 [Cytophagales bacterium]